MLLSALLFIALKKIKTTLKFIGIYALTDFLPWLSKLTFLV